MYYNSVIIIIYRLSNCFGKISIILLFPGGSRKEKQLKIYILKSGEVKVKCEGGRDSDVTVAQVQVSNLLGNLLSLLTK